MSFFVKTEENDGCCSFGDESNNGFLRNESNRRPHLFEFILDILSEPRCSSIISWEGTNGQFRIKNPDLVACLWGERNNRRNMTYQKFSRAIRYYYHKNVLTKIRGRKYTYKFEFRELEKQYGYKEVHTTSEWSGNGRHEMTTTYCCCFCYPIAGQSFHAVPPSMTDWLHHVQEEQARPSSR